ncbi:unnamed protein product [Penicillium olsonii]|uniref:SAC3/GANP/THP3 conserved domain-containing protein n=1 Tax=Penicillium olsonii TaxID=99116 RepID=A0A9W4HJA1_PENOL|nr:unnamed protein product [Penicillium olsonii]CAG8223289.1 unnamed protein product [Penicillium olsonii]
MASPFNPFAAARGQRGGAQGAQGSTGRGRGTTAGYSSTFAPRGSSAPRAGRARGRGRGSATWTARGRGRGAAHGTQHGAHQNAEGIKANGEQSPFAQSQKPVASPFGAQPTPSPFSKPPNGAPTSTFAKPFTKPTPANPFNQPAKNMAHQSPVTMVPQGPVPVEDASTLNSYQERYDQLKIDRAAQRQQAIKDGQMADPNQPTSLNQAITPVGTCTSMCPEFESVERIVQKMVDKCEKYLHPSTNQLQNMETKMLKRFRRSAAGYDEQLPSDIRTPDTLLQTMNYLMRYVLDGKEPLAIVHKFVWDRTRSIRNDFSVQQLTQEADVKVAVTCLERIARFHIVSLHLLSSPENTEPFDRHQEREQLNNTMLSLMYYYDDNRGRIQFANEAEFRAYYILFSIHDQRPDLEARVQKWPPDLLASPRVQVALELFAAAGNTWESQGALDARRPNAVAQGFYTRFFNIINSKSVSYLMACVAEVYFNHIRQTAIRSIWKAYCRTPQSQQSKNDQWTVGELTSVLLFDDDQQTIEFCNSQDLQFAENDQGSIYLDWGDRHVDSVEFSPSTDHSFSETYVESKRAGRNLVAIILGMSINQAASMGMIDRTKVPARRMGPSQNGSADDYQSSDSMVDESPIELAENASQKPDQSISTSFASPFQGLGGGSQTGSIFSAPSAEFKTSNPFAQQPDPAAAQSLGNPFTKPAEANKTATAPVTEGVVSSPFNQIPSQPAPPKEKAFFGFSNPFANKASSTTSNIFAPQPPTLPQTETPQPATATSSTLFSSTSSNAPSIFPKPATTSSTNFFCQPSSPFSFANPLEATRKTDASTEATPAVSSPFASNSPPLNPAASTLFKPFSAPPAPSEAKNPFEGLSSSASGSSTTSSAFPTLSKAPESNQSTESAEVTASAPSALFKSDSASKDSSTTSKNPFGFSQQSFPVVTPANPTPFAAPPGASSLFSFTKAPEATEEPSAIKLEEKKAEPFSFAPAQNQTPAKDSISALPNAPEPSKEPETSAPTEPAPAKQPFVFAPPPTENVQKKAEPFTFPSTNTPFAAKDSLFAKPKVEEPSEEPQSSDPAVTASEKQPVSFSQPSFKPAQGETSSFRSSAPAQVPAPRPLQPEESASVSAPEPATVPPASRSVSGTRPPAYSPPRTLFEALRQPKIFDAKSSTYSPFQPPVNQSPLFQDMTPAVGSDQQNSLKRQHDSTSADTSQHQRRSSIKGSSAAAPSDQSLRRSVHFEETHENQPSSSKKPRVSSVRKSSDTPQKKRQMDEESKNPNEEQGSSSKLAKFSVSDEHTPFKFSVYDAENRQLPKLPILEKLEQKLAEVKTLCEPKPMTKEQLEYVEQERLRRAREVDQDEIALSRARILAQQLKDGPGIFDGWTGPVRKPWDDPNWNPAARILEKYRSRIPAQLPSRPLPPKLILTHSSSGRPQVSYAPDTPLRPMSRTERRIRYTGAHGLAHVPLDFQRGRRAETSMSSRQQKTSQEGNERKDGEKDGPSESS